MLEETDGRTTKFQLKANVVENEKASARTETLNELKDQVKELSTVMKAWIFPKMSHPTADKKNKGNQNNQNCNRNNQRNNGNRSQNRDTRDIRANLLGPTANASEPFMMDNGPSNAINPKDGRHPQRIFFL